jgi:hypothetical protein
MCHCEECNDEATCPCCFEIARAYALAKQAHSLQSKLFHLGFCSAAAIQPTLLLMKEILDRGIV